MTIQNSTNKWAVSRIIVNPTAGLGTHVTVQSAIDDASSGDEVFLMAGQYTEDITMKAGVELTSFSREGLNGEVNIIGKCTYTATGNSYLSNVKITTNSDYCLSMTGSNASVMIMTNCYINVDDNDGVEINNPNAILRMRNTSGGINNSGITFFDVTDMSTLDIIGGNFANAGGSTTASTFTEGTLAQFVEVIFAVPLSIQGACACIILSSYFNTSTPTLLTFNTSATTNRLQFSRFSNTTAVPIVITAGTVTMNDVTINTNNVVAMSGAGTLRYTPISFTGVGGSDITVTTQTRLPFGPDAQIGGSADGLDNNLLVTNTSNTASSTATIECTTAGATAGDPRLGFSTTATSYSLGIDNSVTSPAADPFVVSASAALGTTDVMVIQPTGEITKPLQPAFLGYLPSSDLNVTGTGTLYQLGTTATALTEVYDIGGDFTTAGIFTAPVDGKYYLFSTSIITGCTAATLGDFFFVTSNRNYLTRNTITAGNTQIGLSDSISADMDDGDTALIRILSSGEAGDTDDIFGAAASNFTRFGGYLLG